MKALLKRFKYKTASAPHLEDYIGKTVVIDGKPIVIHSIRGNAFKPAFYEVNDEYLIGMLRFHAQMLGDKSITEEQFKAFEEIEFHVEKIQPDSKKEIEA